MWVAGDGDLPPIWEEVDRVKVLIKGLDILNQVLMRDIPYCQRSSMVR